jgi:hypothetical protein
MRTKRCPYLFSILTLALALFSSQYLLAQNQSVTISIPNTPPPPGADPASCWFYEFAQPYASKGVILNPPFVGNLAGFEAGVSPPQICTNPDLSNLGPISWESGIYGGESLSFDPTIVPNVSSVSLTNVSTFCQIFLQPFPNVMAGHPDLVVTATFSDGTTSTFTVGAANGSTVSVTAPNGKSINSVSLAANQSTEPAACNGILPVVLVAGDITFAPGCGDASRDGLRQQYLSNIFPGHTGITDKVTRQRFVPRCVDITKSAESNSYLFSALNSSNLSQPTVALLANSLLNGQGVLFPIPVSPRFHCCGLDAWVANFGSVPTLNGQANQGSGFRPPEDQVRVYQKLGKTPVPAGRHMFGDAVDLKVTPDQWDALLNAAIEAGADYTETDPKAIKAKLPCSPAVKACVHADWRSATAPRGGNTPYAP